MCEGQINSFEKNRPIIITAKDAYNITKDVVSDRVEEELFALNDQIMQAAENGSYGINIDLLSKEAEELLEKSGYKVSRSFARNEQCVSISWKGAGDDQKRGKG